MIIVFYNQVMRYGIANTVLPLYSLFPLLMILNFIALWTVEYHLILNSSLDAHLDDLHAIQKDEL